MANPSSNKLPPHTRDTIIRCYNEGVEIPAIAERVNRPESTVNHAIAAHRKKHGLAYRRPELAPKAGGRVSGALRAKQSSVTEAARVDPVFDLRNTLRYRNENKIEDEK